MLKLAHPPTNQRGGALQQRQKISGGLFIAHQQLAEAVEPRVSAFNHPTSGAVSLPTSASFLPALPHLRRVTSVFHGLRRRLPGITLVRTQVLSSPPAGFGAHDHKAIQSDRQQFDIMPVGPADDKGQRAASTVHQQAALAAFFFPGRWDWGPPLPAPAALCLASHQCFAMPRQSLPFRHIQPNRLAIAPRRSPASASVESVCERNWRCRTTWAGPSTGNQSAAHKQCRQRFDGLPMVCARHQDAAGNADVVAAPELWAPSAERSARVHRKLPKIGFGPCRQHKQWGKTNQLYLRISFYTAGLSFFPAREHHRRGVFRAATGRLKPASAGRARKFFTPMNSGIFPTP